MRKQENQISKHNSKRTKPKAYKPGDVVFKVDKQIKAKSKPLYKKETVAQDTRVTITTTEGKDRFVGIFNVPSPQLLIIDPKLVQDILITNFKNFSENEFSKWADKDTDPLLGRSPFILSGDEWKQKRAEVTPALTNNRIKASYPIMLSVCGKITKYLEKETKKHLPNGIEVKELAAKYTTEKNRTEQKNLSEIEIAAHTITFFVDGFETSSILISNCIRCLAQNESVQQKLRDEINKTIEENDQCINECLRLRSPSISVNRMCSNTCELMSSKEKPIKIEKGTTVVLPYYALHHDPEYYPNPEAFIPERFSPENGGIKKYKEMGVFFPFGDGPRICLGNFFQFRAGANL
ncbi:unnamed protein product [Hermetia illucens]|uniref:Cytochrome P450 n=1 Tax=Hermetia illucens TaxID=343691 RepID=A0A7R8Z228_HERIL|nr:unnamed protein product [Hermetia illucens]